MLKTLGKCIIFSSILGPNSNAFYFAEEASFNYSSLQDLVSHCTATFYLYTQLAKYLKPNISLRTLGGGEEG